MRELWLQIEEAASLAGISDKDVRKAVNNGLVAVKAEEKQGKNNRIYTHRLVEYGSLEMWIIKRNISRRYSHGATLERRIMKGLRS